MIEPERVASTRRLRELLRTNNGRHGSMTTIQKFEEVLNAPAGRLGQLNDADNVIVMVDEAHRTQYGPLAAKMRAAMPQATFVGFTGTPIDKDFRRTTLGVFGSLIDSYTILQSVEDGATVPIYYEARLPELHVEGSQTLDRLFESPLRRRVGGDARRDPPPLRQQGADRGGGQAHRSDRPRHCRALQEEGPAERLQSPGGGAKPRRRHALRAAPERTSACRPTRVITTSHNDGPEFDAARDLNQDKIVEDFIDPDGEPQVLVVVDKLITGFDAPVEQVLYLDRSIREHTLLQAIARVNRRFAHTKKDAPTEKQYGLVVDYHGVSRELESALAIFDSGDLEQALTELPEDPGPVIQAAADKAEAHFRGLDLDEPWACVHHFDADATTEGDYKADAYERFDRDYGDFSALMDRYLPDPAALAYLDRLRRLTVIRSYVRAPVPAGARRHRLDGHRGEGEAAARLAHRRERPRTHGARLHPRSGLRAEDRAPPPR